MKTNNKCAAVRLEKSKLVAALAILAVAFVVIAAVPAVADDSDATGVQVAEVSTSEALQKALENDSNIKLTANITITSTLNVTKTNTVDLNGFNITGDKVRVFQVTGKLTLDGNGTITSTQGITETSSVIRVGSNGTTGTPSIVVKKDVTIDAPYSHALGLFGKEAKITADIYGTIQSATGTAIINNGSKDFNSTEITINSDAVIRSTGTDDSVAIYHPGRGVLNISGGTIEGVGSAIAMKSGTLNITGGTITATGNAVMPPAGYSNGINASGAAIQIESNKSYYGNPDNTYLATYDSKNAVTLNITGGTLESKNAVAIYEYLSDEKNKDGSPTTTKTSVGSISINNATLKSAFTTDIQVSKECVTENAITIKGGTFSKAIDYAQGITVSVVDKSILAADVKFSITGQTMAVANGGAYDGTISFNDSSAVISGLKAGAVVTISAASIHINGVLTPADASGNIVVSGEATVSGTLDKGVTLTINTGANVTVNDNLTINGKLVVKEDSSNAANSGTVIIDNGKKLIIGKDGSAVVGGTITPQTNGTGAIENAGTITITNKDADVTANVSGTGNVDTSGAQSEGGISGEWKTTTTYTKFQTVTLLGNTTLTAGTVITIEGTLVIPEGTTLVIEDGAQLIVSGGFGKIQNAGTIEVQSNDTGTVAGLLVNNGALIENSGSIVLNYTIDDSTSDFEFYVAKVAFDMNGKLDNTGDIDVGEQSYLKVGTGADFVNKGTVVSKGMISGIIKNESTVTVDGTVSGNLTVNNIADGATVEVVSAIALETGSVIVNNDIGLSKPSDVKEYTEDSETTLALDKQFAVKGLTVSSTLVKDTKNSTTTKTIYDRYNVLAGTLTINQVNDYESASATITVTLTAKGNSVVKDNLDIPAGVTLSITGVTTPSAYGTFVVEGTVVEVKGEVSYTYKNGTATESGKTTSIGSITIDSNAVLKVSGSITSANALTPTNKINATYYKVDATTNPVVAEKHVYTTFAPAVASGAKKITVYGENKVSENVSVPAGVTITTVEGKLTVDKDATIIVADGAKMINGASGSVKVEGTLTFDAFKTGDKLGNTVISEVVIQGEKDRTYTNLANAIAKAQSGSTITLSGPADITSDLTIPEGIKIDTKEYKVTVGKNATLTVDGELFLNGASSTLTLEDPASEFDKDGAVVVNGVISSTEGFNSKVFLGTDGYVIPGAYYSMTEKTNTTYYVTPVADAAKLISTVDDQKVTIDGKEVATGDVAFTGVDGTATVIVNTELTASSITLDNAKLVLNAGKKISATVTNGVGTVVLKGTVGTSDMNIVSSGADDSKKITIDGVFVVSTATGSTDKMTVDGTVNFANFNVDKMTVDGTAVVAEGKTLSVATLIVNGTVTVSKDATLTSTVLAEVKGTIAVAQKSADEPKEGKFIAKDLYIGTTKNATKNTAAAAASVTGKVSVDNILVAAAGVIVPETFTAEDSTYINTEFYVGNGLYITVYAKNPNTTPITDFGASKDNAKFEGWSTVDGDATKKVADSVYIGTKDKVYALFNEKIYMVTVVFGAGIENVAIDGNLVSADTTGAYVVRDLKAGTHTVTYSLSNNYSGTATLTVNGEKQSGMTFTASGTNYNYPADTPTDAKKYVNYTLQLSGVTASGYAPAPTPAPSTGDDDGLSITDYLLIVLVILIVIMAIIVAMRLMRS